MRLQNAVSRRIMVFLTTTPIFRFRYNKSESKTYVLQVTIC